MNHELQQVERYMLNLGLTVRHQPVTSVDVFETVHYFEKLYSKLHELANRCGVEIAASPQLKVEHSTETVKPEILLRRLAELHYLVLNLYKAFGLSRFASLAFTEVHESNMSKVWPDGKIHRVSFGQALLPDTFHYPDMTKVLAHYSPPLFVDHKPLPEVTHTDEATD